MSRDEEFMENKACHEGESSLCGICLFSEKARSACALARRFREAGGTVYKGNTRFVLNLGLTIWKILLFSRSPS